MWEIFREHLRGLALLALGLGGALQIVDQWVTPIPVGAIGFSLLFFLGIGSGAAVVREYRTQRSRQALGSDPDSTA